jgi:outer membrane protein OmpA-like peptidoglycan-associated protein
MKILCGFSTIKLSVAITAALMASCASVPKPAVPDGSTRSPVNDPTRLAAFQQNVALDRATQTENSQLRAHVDVLRSQIDELRAIVREALLLPPPSAQAKTRSPDSISPATIKPATETKPVVQTDLQNATDDLPKRAVDTYSTGVVVRVFHAFSQSHFKPSEPVAQLLKRYAANADAIEIRAMTDSNVVSAGDRAVASARASKALVWLVNNGANPNRIRSEFFSAGHFLVDNRTEQGRSLNRRVEIEFRGSLQNIKPPFVAAETVVVKGPGQS